MSGKLQEVTAREFNDWVGPRDVIVHVERDHTDWELRDRTLVGRTIPGYLGMAPKRYFLIASVIGS